jgi:hypothetical protein
MPQYFGGLAENQKQQSLNSEIMVYECQGTESEIKEWFKTINIAGVPLNNQELLNAVYSGPFVTKGKEEFSNSQNANIQKWSAYVKGSVNRQEFWETALEWVSEDKDNIGEYMSRHRFDEDISEVKTYFNTVIDWVSGVFLDVENEMRGLEWGRLYELYHKQSYNPASLSKRLRELYGDPYVKNRKGIWEYLLGGEKDKNLLDVRVFDEATKKVQYVKQTSQAEASGMSNCPLCSVGDNDNKTRIWKIQEMDADHVEAWSKGGATASENCQMLCKTHNRAKGNR